MGFDFGLVAFTWFLKYIMERMTSNVSEVPSSAVSMGSEIAFMQDCSGELKKTKIHFDIVAQLGNMVHRL